LLLRSAFTSALRQRPSKADLIVSMLCKRSTSSV
jgi:hypothetical protein